MDTLTDRLERLAELQKKNIEPLQQLGGNAFTAFERVARKNYELMGDMVEYAVAQSRGSLDQSSPQALYEHQMAEARAFAERMSERAAEYLALAEQMRDGVAAGATQAAEKVMDRTAANADAVRADVPGTVPAKPKAEAAGTGKATPKRSTTGKATAKKTSTKKAPAKKPTAKKSAAKKKSTAKKSSAKGSASGKKSAAKTASKKKGSASRKRG